MDKSIHSIPAQTNSVSGARLPYSPEPVLRKLCDSPRILICEQFLTDDECQRVIALACKELRRSEVMTSEDNVFAIEDIRTSSNAFLENGHVIVAEIEDRIAQLMKIPAANGEIMTVLHYGLEEKYGLHCDFFDPQVHFDTLAKSGQRIATVLIYLSDVEEGGNTIFPKRGISIKPKKGTLLAFANVYPGGSLNHDSLHASEPVKRGEKWIISKFLRERPWIE